MAIVFSCACGQQYTVDDSLAGKSGKCKKCGERMVIPQKEEPKEGTEADLIFEDEPPKPATKPTTKPVADMQLAPAKAAPDDDGDGDEDGGPGWFEGYVSVKASQRDLRVYRVGDELLLIDAGQHYVDNQQAAARVGAATGGLVGALAGLAAGALAKKLGERANEESKRRKLKLEEMTDEELLQEADAGPPAGRIAIKDIDQADLLPQSMWGDAGVLAVLTIHSTGRGKAQKTKIYLGRQPEVKAAARLLREAVGKQTLRVKVPLSKKAVAKAEAKQKRTHRIVQISFFAGCGVIILAVLLPLLFRGGKPNAAQGGGDGGDPAVAPADFVAADAPAGDATAPNPEVAKRREHRQLIRKLAEEAPPFDPANPPTMRSPIAHLVSQANLSDALVYGTESRLKGEALPPDADAKFLDRLLRGQVGAPAADTAAKATKPVWEPIPIDKPSAPFKLGLTAGLPLETNSRVGYRMGVMNGPLYVPYPWWLEFRPPGDMPWDLARDPKNRNRYVEKIKKASPPHPVIDLRDGKSAGEFDWRAPVWANARLSPDGSYLAGPDSFSTLYLITHSTQINFENGKGQIFVWGKGKKAPTSIKVPGEVDWMEFAGNDRLAFLTYTPKPVLRIHDVAKNRQLAEVELPGDLKPRYPDSTFDQTPVYPGLDFYRPMPRRGAVSATGKYAAVGFPDGVRLFSVTDGKLVGLLPLTKASIYRGMTFSADGNRLYAVVTARGRYGDACMFKSWSVARGELLEEIEGVDPYISGPFVAGPVEGLFAGSKFVFTRHPLALDEPPFRQLVAVDDDGTALVLNPRDKAPAGTPPPRSLEERIKLKLAKPEEAESSKASSFAIYPTKVDWSKPIDKVKPLLTLLSPRPPAKVGDLAGVVAQKPDLPATRVVPSFATAPQAPADSDDPKEMHQFGAWPHSFGDDKAALVRYAAKSKFRRRYEVWFDLLDRHTGKRAAPAVKLWDWAVYPDEMGTPDEPANPGYIGPVPLPPRVALRPDAGMFALVDPNEARRLDLFKPTGERVLGLIPHPDRRIDWLAWTRTHLLTVGGGRLTAWDPSSGKATFEVDGGYSHIGEISPDRQWVVLWTGRHADILDSATGKCLGRLQAGGFSGRLFKFSLSPDGRYLAAAFTGWPKGYPGGRPGYTAVIWSLETGKAGLHGFASENDGRFVDVPTVAWAGAEHLLVSGRPLTEQAVLIDARLGMPVGNYKMKGGGYMDRAPVLGGPDGRLWYPTTTFANPPEGFNRHAPNHPDFPSHFAYRVANLPGLSGKETFLADAGRDYVDMTEKPVQVQAKAGTKAQSEALARSVAKVVQSQGFRVGPGGTVLRVEGALGETNEEISFTFGSSAKIPRCEVSARWLTPSGGEVWKGKTTQTWSMGGSKYKVSEKSEHFGPAGGGVRRFEFNFQGRRPSEAMREELLDTLGIFGNWLTLPDLQVLRGGGQDRPVPVGGVMEVRAVPEAK